MFNINLRQSACLLLHFASQRVASLRVYCSRLVIKAIMNDCVFNVQLCSDGALSAHKC